MDKTEDGKNMKEKTENQEIKIQAGQKDGRQNITENKQRQPFQLYVDYDPSLGLEARAKLKDSLKSVGGITRIITYNHINSFACSYDPKVYASKQEQQQLEKQLNALEGVRAVEHVLMKYISERYSKK